MPRFSSKASASLRHSPFFRNEPSGGTSPQTQSGRRGFPARVEPHRTRPLPPPPPRGRGVACRYRPVCHRSLSSRSRRDVLIARLQNLERAPPSLCLPSSPSLTGSREECGVVVDGPKPPSGAPLRGPLSPRSTRRARAERETVGTAPSPRGTYVVGSSSGRWTPGNNDGNLFFTAPSSPGPPSPP